MIKIGILSDTHGNFSGDVCEFLSDADEIWHAGDIGNIGVADEIAALKPLRAVYGNIDGEEVRRHYPRFLHFACEGVEVLMTHIGGYPQHYHSEVRTLLQQHRPQLFVCGHSHILRVMYDKKLQMLCINPGAAGHYGFHQVRTAIRLRIHNGNISDLEVGEWKRKA
ncbi:phosphoesterase [Bacteroidia bacterium]|nr:phosphoesterase [Bacteroidia bacterium]